MNKTYLLKQFTKSLKEMSRSKIKIFIEFVQKQALEHNVTEQEIFARMAKEGEILYNNADEDLKKSISKMDAIYKKLGLG